MSKLSSKNLFRNNILLIGTPNAGKSTIFNLLTNKTNVVGNIDRMTTEHYVGEVKKLSAYNLIDLPGIYNLSHPLDEEEEVCFHLLEKRSDALINVVNAYSLERDLYLTIQCYETGLLNSIVINMVDLVDLSSLDLDKLQTYFPHINFIFSQANNNKNVKQITDQITKRPVVDNQTIVYYDDEIERLLTKIVPLLPQKLQVSPRFFALMLLEGNELFYKFLQENNCPSYQKIISLISSERHEHYAQIIDQKKRDFVQLIFAQCIKKKTFFKKDIKAQSKFDHYFLKPWIGIPCFLLLITTIYFVCFSSYVGGFLSNQVDYFLNDLLCDQWLRKLFELMHSPQWCTSLFIDGIFKGIFLVLPFIPTILLLYLFVTIIQQIGLLSRVSILLDNFLEKFGLSGRSIVNIMTGFGCTVPALMLARSSSSKKERIISLLITPFCLCTSRIILIDFVLSCFPILRPYSWLIILALIIFSAIIAFCLGFFFSEILFRKQQSFFCVEMVRWNGIDLRVLFKTLWFQLKSFLFKVFSIVIIGYFIIWILLHLGPHGFNAQLTRDSFLYYLAYGLSYLFYPIFWNSEWELTAVIIAGIPAKELIVSTMTALNVNIVNMTTMWSFIVFNMFFLPCLPTISCLKKELSNKYFWIGLGTYFITAYTLACLIGSIGNLITL